jgi:ribonuclease HI
MGFSVGSKRIQKEKNPDLWIRFLKAYRKHNVRFVWIKGHASNPENELCDRLAVEASKNANLSEDIGYKPEELDDELFNNSNK